MYGRGSLLTFGQETKPLMHPNHCIKIISIPLIRTLLVLTVFAASALADDASLIVGHWRFEYGGFTFDHYFGKDGRYRYKWVMAKGGEVRGDSHGTYKIVDGVLQLYGDFPPGKPPEKIWYTVDANNFTIIGGVSSPSKKVFKRVLDKK